MLKYDCLESFVCYLRWYSQQISISKIGFFEHFLMTVIIKCKIFKGDWHFLENSDVLSETLNALHSSLKIRFKNTLL